MKYLLTLFGLVGSMGLWAQAEFTRNYSPAVSHSEMPPAYFANLAERAHTLAQAQEIIDEKDAEALYLETGRYLKTLIQNGYIHYDHPLTGYVQEVAKQVFTSNPAALQNISFFVTPSADANAVSFPDGTILVNMGLLLVLDNEAQLAFVLAHEVGHFHKKHALKAYKQWQALKDKKDDTENEKKEYLQLIYSRENEAEADAYALSIVGQSPFDARQGRAALANIEKEDTALVAVRPELVNLFQSDNFRLDSSLVNLSQKFRHVSASVIHNKHSIFRGDPDNRSSHPATDKRQAAVDEILQGIEYSPEGKKLNFSETTSANMKHTAWFEMMHYSYESGDYFMALALASELAKAYPENVFVQKTILKSLYWIAYYKEINSLDHLDSDLPVFNRARYWFIGKIMNKSEGSTLKKMAYAYAKKVQKPLEQDDEFNFYRALTVDQYLGKEAASVFYTQYEAKFPAGKYLAFVNDKKAQP